MQQSVTRVPVVDGRRSAKLAQPSRPTAQAGYMRGLPESGLTLSGPVPALREASDDVRVAWTRAAARAVDAMHNNGWIAGAVEKSLGQMIGAGLKPNIKPDFSWAGWDDKRSAEWARRAEKRFIGWSRNAYECDAGGRYTLAQMQAAAVRSWFGTGEALAQYPTVVRRGGQWATKLRMIPTNRLVQRSSPFERLTHGVFLDAHAAPAGYAIEVKDVASGTRREIRVPARDGFGRPVMVHVFDGAAGQIRGITPFAPILRVLRNYDQLSDATLTAAMIHAIFAATIESDYPNSEVLDALKSDDEVGDERVSRFDSFMGEKVGWHQSVDIDLGRNGKIAHLMLGEKLKLHGSEHPNSTYEAFANFLLREIASCAAVMFEDLTGDYRGATYSSVRMGISKLWPVTLYRREHIPGPISQAALEAFLEEEVDSGSLPVPGGIDAFVANKAAICRADWRGPAKPQADDLKAAKAHETYRRMGVVSDEQIASDLGHDIDDVYAQRAAEQEHRDDLRIHGGLSGGGDGTGGAGRGQEGDDDDDTRPDR